MNELLQSLPTTLVGWIAAILATSSSILFIFSKIRKNDMDILRQSNVDLRAAIDDNQRALEKMHDNIIILNGKVADLEKKNKTLEDLVVVALKQYFFENPTLAKDIQKKITG